MQVRKRSEIDKKYLWDINSMYGSDKAWQEDVDKALEKMASSMEMTIPPIKVPMTRSTVADRKSVV